MLLLLLLLLFLWNINTVNDDLETEKAKMWDFSVHGLLIENQI